MTKTSLVTAAAGKTGGYAVPLLLERGHSVRALVRKVDARADQLQALGAKVVVADLHDLQAVRAVMDGVESAYFCYPIAPRLLEATVIFAQAAREASVGVVVNMSQISARSDAGSDAARLHWLGERLFDWSGVPTTHLRPTFFAEWLTMLARPAENGAIRLPFGEGRHAPIAAADQARVIAAILDDPAPHAGRTYELFGPVEMTHHEIAAEMTRVLNHPIYYEPVTVEAFADALRVRGLPAHVVQHLCAVALDYRNGLFAGSNDVVERVGGAPGIGVASFVADRRAAFQ